MGLTSDYHRFFETFEAKSSRLIREAHRIRYEVYCKEFGFEDAAAHPDGMEIDAYDAHSRHCLLLHKPSGTFAGCVRLILTNPSKPQAALPFEKSCAHALRSEKLNISELSRDTFGEISRLAIRRPFRRRRGEIPHPDGFSIGSNPPFQLDRRHMPKMVVGLYLAAAAVGLSHGLDSVFAMMEPRLARHLALAGIRFEQVSDLVDHHGPRAAFQITRDGLYENLNPEMKDLLDVINDELVSSDYEPSTESKMEVA